MKSLFKGGEKIKEILYMMCASAVQDSVTGS